MNALQRKSSIAAANSGISDAGATQKPIAQKEHSRKESTKAPPPINTLATPLSPDLPRRTAGDTTREIEDLKAKIRVCLVQQLKLVGLLIVYCRCWKKSD